MAWPWDNVERLRDAAREGRSEAGGSTTDSAPPLTATIAGEAPARSVGEGATLAATGFAAIWAEAAFSSRQGT